MVVKTALVLVLGAIVALLTGMAMSARAQGGAAPPQAPPWVMPDGRSAYTDVLVDPVPVVDSEGRLKRDANGNVVTLNPGQLRPTLTAPRGGQGGAARSGDQPEVLELPPDRALTP